MLLLPQPAAAGQSQARLAKKKTDPIWSFASFSCCSEGKLISSVRGGSAMEKRLEAAEAQKRFPSHFDS